MINLIGQVLELGIFSKDRRYFNKASGYLKKGDFQKAIEYFDKALEINPNYAVAWNDKGFAFANMDMFDEALKCYNKSLKIRPNFSPSLLNKAKLLLYEFDDYGKAINYHDIFLKMDKKVLKKEIKNFAEYSDILLDVLNDKGWALFNLGKYKEAIFCYDKVLKLDPNYIMAWNNKGTALDDLGRFNEALKCYDKALEIEPNFSYPLMNKAKLLLYELDDYEGALDYYNILLKMDKKVLKEGIAYFNYVGFISDAWNDKGLALFNLERYNGAIECYSKALEFNSSHRDALKNKEIAENELNDLKKNVKCPNCGAENPDTSGFCQECGSKLDSTIENMLCPQCNFKVDNEVKFCPECGENLEIKKETLIDINNDLEDEIVSIPGIGPILAKKAIQIRESKNGFDSIEDFCVSMGLKPHIASRVEDHITCNPIKKPEKPKFSSRVVDW